MCLYPKLIKNPKYKPTRKNNFNPPPIAEYDENGNFIKYIVDPRVLFVPIGCGNCIECRKQKARQWQVRLNEEKKEHTYKYCLTLTFSNDKLEELCKTYKMKECNAIVTKAMRLFLERWRKKHKKSLCHWFITELGQDNTERIHLHGIVFSNEIISQEKFEQFWQYGHIRLGNWYGLRTINYLIKYVHKIDPKHKDYLPIILCSKGIGANYLKRPFTKSIHKITNNGTTEFYRLDNGTKINLPIYYRNKLWTEKEREDLWLKRLDKHERFVMGIKIDNIDTPAGEKLYYSILRTARQTNAKLGFGDDSKEWQKRDYNVTLRMLNKMKRIEENKKR